MQLQLSTLTDFLFYLSIINAGYPRCPRQALRSRVLVIGVREYYVKSKEGEVWEKPPDKN